VYSLLLWDNINDNGGIGIVAGIDVITEVVCYSFLELDTLMRKLAFTECQTEPKRWRFCLASKMCIEREWINVFWEKMVARN